MLESDPLIMFSNPCLLNTQLIILIYNRHTSLGKPNSISSMQNQELYCVTVPFNIPVLTSASCTGDVLLLLMVSWTIVIYEKRQMVSGTCAFLPVNLYLYQTRVSDLAGCGSYMGTICGGGIVGDCDYVSILSVCPPPSPLHVSVPLGFVLSSTTG